MTGEQKSLMVIVGDVSADMHIVKVLRRIKEMDPDLKIWGLGGDCMEELGVELLHHQREMNAVGIFEVVKYLPQIWKVKASVIDAIKTRQPDLILMVDCGGFNLRIAKATRKRFPQRKIHYFISPQVWASRPWRIKTVAKNVSKMLVIFPFEEPLYKNAGVDAKFVGHPLTEQIRDEIELMSREDFCNANKLNPNNPIVGVFPGSRKQEIHYHLPVLLRSIKELTKTRPELQFVISRADKTLTMLIDEICLKEKVDYLQGKNLFFMDGKSNYDLMNQSEIVWVKSGTTTLEVTMFGKPMLVFYKGNWLTYFIVMMFKTIQNVAMPNILAGHRLVPELLQLDCTPQQLVRYTSDLFDTPGLRNEISAELRTLRQQLGEGDYVENLAEEVCEALGSRQQAAIS